MMRVVTVVGTRPQLVKAAALSRYVRERHVEVLVNTGQHYDYEMSQLLIEELSLPSPDYDLGVGSGTHAFQTGETLMRVERVLLKERPDMVLVYGDTNSTLAAALAAAKLNMSVGHVEAGIRHHDRSVPEEVNRVVTDALATLLFCPTEHAVANLRAEGRSDGVYWTGDVMYDLLLGYVEQARRDSRILRRLGLECGRYFVATVHRASNTDAPDALRNIFSALIEAEQTVVIPLHPRTRQALEALGMLEQVEAAERLLIVPPVGYIDFLALQMHAALILTDSGGVQKESYLLGVPCVTLRPYSPWPETVVEGWNMTVSPDKTAILNAIRRARASDVERSTGAFGNGHAAEAICDVLGNWEATALGTSG